MPTSDGAEQLKAGELEEAKKLIAVQKVECQFESIDQAIERETEYITKYDEDLKPRRQERIANEAERNERKAAVQSEILQLEEQRAKALAAQRDAEFAEKLRQEERAELERQRILQEQEQEKDNHAFTLMSQNDNLDFTAARGYLEQALGDFSKAQQLIQQSNSQQITIVRQSDGIPIDTKYFLKNAEGMEIIQYLVSWNNPGEGKYYNLHTDNSCTNALTYTALTAQIGQLNLQENAVLYFTIDNEPKF